MNAEDRDGRPDPEAADHQPEDTAADDNPGGLRGFFRPAPKKPKKPKGSTKAKKPKTPAQLRRERQQANRRIKMGVRYSNNRRLLPIILAAIVGSVVLALIAIGLASSKPNREDINAAVDDRLEASGYEFPRGEAVMWAGQALRVWGTWDQENPEAREVALAPFLSAGMDTQAGWNERGTQQLIYASVNPEPIVTDESHASVEAVYQTNDGIWRCVSVPVYAYHPEDPNLEQEWSFAMAGNPTPVACAPRTGAPDAAGDAAPGQEDEGLSENDEIAEELASSFYPGFFSAWASSDSNALNQYTASGVTVTGLGGAMAATPQPQIGDTRIWVDEEPVDGKVYYAYVPVTFQVTGSDTMLTAAYVVPMKRDQDRWFVAGEPEPAQQSTEVGGAAPSTIPQPDVDVVPETFAQQDPTPAADPSTAAPSDGASAEPSASASASSSPSASASASSDTE